MFNKKTANLPKKSANANPWILAGVALVAGLVYAGSAQARGNSANDNATVAGTNPSTGSNAAPMPHSNTGGNSDVVGIGTTTGSNGSTAISNDTTDSKTSMAGMNAARNSSAPSRTTGDGTSTGMSSAGSAMSGR